MGLFQTLKDKIFGGAEAKEVAAKKPAAPAPAAAAAAGAAPAAKPAMPAAQPVDLDEVLTYMEKKSGQQLNWRTSIVDLMKLVNMDSSLAARKELAEDLGYTGDTSDSATMNIWLHKQVMAKLAQTKA